MRKYRNVLGLVVLGLLAACQQHSPDASLTNPTGVADGDVQAYCQQLQAIKGKKPPEPIPAKFQGNEQAETCWSQVEHAWDFRPMSRSTQPAAPDPASVKFSYDHPAATSSAAKR
jgi:hypothetical protein